jgi:hypothetical protein
VSVMDSQGAVTERLERCAIELWAVDNRVRGEGECNWDALGWGDRRDYRWMAAAVLREAGLGRDTPSEGAIDAAARSCHDSDSVPF